MYPCNYDCHREEKHNVKTFVTPGAYFRGRVLDIGQYSHQFDYDRHLQTNYFIYGLFNDAISTSHCMAPNDELISEPWIAKEVVVA